MDDIRAALQFERRRRKWYYWATSSLPESLMEEAAPLKGRIHYKNAECLVAREIERYGYEGAKVNSSNQDPDLTVETELSTEVKSVSTGNRPWTRLTEKDVSGDILVVVDWTDIVEGRNGDAKTYAVDPSPLEKGRKDIKYLADLGEEIVVEDVVPGGRDYQSMRWSTLDDILAGE